MNTDDDVARAVLAKACFYDPSMPRPDESIVKAWAEALGEMPISDGIAAVAAHYRAQSRRIMPADVVALARSYAAERAMRALPDAGPVDVDRQRQLASWARSRFNQARGVAAGGDDVLHRAALGLYCPWPPCAAPPRQRCRTNGRDRAVFHPGRLEAAAESISEGKVSV